MYSQVILCESPFFLGKLDPPFNLHYYNVTTDGEVMFTWNDSQSSRYPLNYEIRYSSNTTLQHWKVSENDEIAFKIGTCQLMGHLA